MFDFSCINCSLRLGVELPGAVPSRGMRCRTAPHGATRHFNATRRILCMNEPYAALRRNSDSFEATAMVYFNLTIIEYIRNWLLYHIICIKLQNFDVTRK